jgi:hypothetical protein
MSRRGALCHTVPTQNTLSISVLSNPGRTWYPQSNGPLVGETGTDDVFLVTVCGGRKNGLDWNPEFSGAQFFALDEGRRPGSVLS